MDFYVNSVKKRPTNSFLIVLNLASGTRTIFNLTTMKTTGAGVHGGNKDEVGRIGDFLLGS